MDEKLYQDLFPQIAKQHGEDAAQQAFVAYWQQVQAGAVIAKPEHYIRRSARRFKLMGIRQTLARPRTLPLPASDNERRLRGGVRPARPIPVQSEQYRRAEARQALERLDPVLVRRAVNGPGDPAERQRVRRALAKIK